LVPLGHRGKKKLGIGAMQPDLPLHAITAEVYDFQSCSFGPSGVRIYLDPNPIAIDHRTLKG